MDVYVHMFKQNKVMRHTYLHVIIKYISTQQNTDTKEKIHFWLRTKSWFSNKNQ